MEKTYGFDTLQVHAGWRNDPETRAHAVPLYQTAAYEFESAEDAALQFTGERPGSIYSRIQNPTVHALEERLCALENGYKSTCFATGMAALLAVTLTLAEPGDEVISLANLYGGSYSLLFGGLERRYGVKAHRIENEDMDGLASAINDKTRMIYFEPVSNPLADIPDIRAITALAHDKGIPVVCDNTFPTPYLFDAAAHQIDITLHSLTKYLCGNGTSLGGAITDLGRFPFQGSPRFPHFNAPDATHHGRVYAALGADAFSARLRDYWLHDTGFTLSPFNAFLILLGSQTLSLRMAKHVQNADAAASFLAANEHVCAVNYPRLPNSPYRERARAYMPKGAGSVFTFRIHGGYEACTRFIDALRLLSLVSNVGDVRSLATHPASTTHSPLSPADQERCGITPDMIRLSVGIEDAADIIADLAQALDASIG